jgi:hypothetical protein
MWREDSDELISRDDESHEKRKKSDIVVRAERSDLLGADDGVGWSDS